MTVSMLQTLLWQLVQAVVVIVAVMGNRFHSSWFPGGRGVGGLMAVFLRTVCSRGNEQA